MKVIDTKTPASDAWVIFAGALVLLGITLFGTGCSQLGDRATVSSHDFIMAGNANGINAFYAGQVGSLKTMVEKEGDSKYFGYREKEDKEITRRHEAGDSMWQRAVANARRAFGVESNPSQTAQPRAVQRQLPQPPDGDENQVLMQANIPVQKE